MLSGMVELGAEAKIAALLPRPFLHLEVQYDPIPVDHSRPRLRIRT
jgi:hypothetical protein